MSAGEQKVWEELARLTPGQVCRNASVSYDETGPSYIIRSLGTDFSVNPKERVIKNLTPEGETLINRYGYFFKLSCLWYLVNAKNIPLSDRLIKPAALTGGDQFFGGGTHILPLDNIANKYGDKKEAFIQRAQQLNAGELSYGDASVKLFPLPRIPVIFILWTKDEEFPPRVDLLFDSSCKLHAPLDILWSIAMFTVQMLS